MKLHYEMSMRQKVQDAINNAADSYPKLDRITLTHDEWDNLMAEYRADPELSSPSSGTHLVVVQGIHVGRARR